MPVVTTETAVDLLKEQQMCMMQHGFVYIMQFISGPASSVCYGAGVLTPDDCKGGRIKMLLKPQRFEY